MKKFLSMMCVLVMAGTVAACETARKEVDAYEAKQAAERAEAKAEAALRAARSERIQTEQKAYDSSMRK